MSEIPVIIQRRIANARRNNHSLLNLSARSTGFELDFIPDEVFELTHLREFFFSGNNLARIPSEIVKLKKLEELDLSFNRISACPDELNRLTKLRGLDLTGNRLSEIPEVIRKLHGLSRLYLSKNKISEVSDDIVRLKNLTVLKLDDNIIRSLPYSITELYELVKFSIYNNPLENPPEEIAVQGLYSLRTFFDQLEEEGSDLLFEAKLLIVGEPGAGKTTMMEKLLDPNYKLVHDGYTKGIVVNKWKFNFHSGKEFVLNIWDFGGQEIYHSTHQFFLTRRSLYTVVIDTRREDADFYYWMNSIQLLGENSPVLLVKNERFDIRREINESRLKKTFPNFEDSVSVNFSTNRGLPKLVKQIQKFVLKLPLVGAKLPKTWTNIRGLLEEDTRNYLSLEEYLKICSENGVSSEEKALQLSRYFHDIGVFLHFQEDDLLFRTIILKPKWGTDSVYKVLDNPHVKKNKGKFHKTKLRSIWSENEYRSVRGELLALMMKFDLCYQLEDSDEYIAPQLLPANQPEYKWDKKNNIVLIYEYDFMPKGIITRFVVRMNRYIKNHKLVWREGVILERKNGIGEVIEERIERKRLVIRVRGENKNQLITIIGEEIDRINSSYKKLVVEKFVPCNCTQCSNLINPHFYKYSDLETRRLKNKLTVECSISFENISVNNLLNSILDIEFLDIINKEKIKNLLTKGDLGKALELSAESMDSTFDSELRMLSSRLNRLRSDYFSNGVLSSVQYNLEFNRISTGLLELVNEN